MIRPRPTQISIGPRDIAWHVERHVNRQVLRANNKTVEVIASPTQTWPKTPEKEKANLPRYSPSPHLLEKAAINSKPEAEPSSTKPVPQDCKEFRESNLAQARMLDGIRIQNVEKRPRIIEQSYDSQEIIRSSRASIEEDTKSTTGSYADPLGIVPSTDLSFEAEMAPHLRSFFSSESDGSSEDHEDDQEEVDHKDLFQGTFQFTLPIRSSAIRSNSNGLEEKVETEDPAMNSFTSSRHLNLDGTTDKEFLYPHRKKGLKRIDREAEPDLTPHSAQSYRGTKGRESKHEFNPEAPEFTPIDGESLNQASLPRVSVPRPAEIFGRRLSCLPRSQLYISQAVASSSPEKHTRLSSSLSDDSSNASTPREIESPVQHLHCRKKHRIHRESSTSLTSEAFALDHSSMEYPLEGSSYSLSSPSGSIDNNQQISTSSSSHPFLNSSPASSQRVLSSNALSSEGSPSPTKSPRSLPRFPFSATSRIVSFNGTLPSPSASIRSSPRSITTTSPSRVRNRFTIYNDQLPAASQPQTPARLPRNGVRAMSSQSAFSNGMGIQTAPPATRGERRFQAVTPTRRGRTLEDQENAGVMVEAGRMLNRLRTRRARNGSATVTTQEEWTQEDWFPEDEEGDE